jgi:predicted RNA-binding protein YlqC (UPF0109 family)
MDVWPTLGSTLAASKSVSVGTHARRSTWTPVVGSRLSAALTPIESPMEQDDDDLILDEGTLLTELVRSIVRNPQKVSVEVVKGSKSTMLTLTVDPSDRGQVIGKDRKTLDALEHLFGKAAYLDGRKVVIQLDGPDVPKQRTKFQPRGRR